MTKPVKVTVLGCAVNGPGEAEDADIGVACSKGKGQLYIHGKPSRFIPEDQLVQTVYDDNAVNALQLREVFGLGVNFGF